MKKEKVTALNNKIKSAFIECKSIDSKLYFKYQK